jgi:parvulin-like peptidyl-prolyl isomerase
MKAHLFLEIRPYRFGFFQPNLGRFSMADQIRASHILIAHNEGRGASTPRTRDEAAQQIGALKDQIAEGADFADVARENSDCPSSAGGGDLGMFPRGAMVQPFDDTAFGLGVGDVSDVVETEFGYHLIHRTE